MSKAVDYINVAIVGDFERGYYVSKDDAIKAVEFERTEMIGKVCKWLSQHLYDNVYLFRDDEGTWVDTDLVVDDLKKAMEE